MAIPTLKYDTKGNPIVPGGGKAPKLSYDRQGNPIVPKVSGGKKAAAPKRWGSAFLSNLEDFARGIGPGAAHLVKATWNDLDVVTGDVLPGNNARKNGFMWDDVAKAVGSDYKTRYAPLFKGDFKEFVDQVATKPLDFLLDAATIATLGTGAVVQGGVKGATAGAKAAARAGRAVDVAEPTGALKAAGFVARTPENLAAAERVFGKASKEVRQAAEAGVVRGVRRIGNGDVVLERAAKMNPVLRGRDAALDRIMGAEKLAGVPVVGVNARAARQDRRRPALKADVARQRMLGDPGRKLRKLRPDAQAAWFFHHTSTDPEEYATKLREKLDAGDLNDRDALVLEATIERIEKPEVRALYEQPTEDIVAAVRATRKLADEDMPDLLTNLTTFTHRDILERRMLQQRVLDGATPTDRHPEQQEPTKRARIARRQLEEETRRREQDRGRITRDVERFRDVGAATAARLRAARAVLLERITDAASAARQLKDDRPQARERPMLRDEALRDAPDRVRMQPEPGDVPDPADVEAMIASMRRKIARGGYASALKQLRGWIDELYNLERYGTRTPSKEQVRAEGRDIAAAKRRPKLRRGGVSPVELLSVVERQGAWSAGPVRLLMQAGDASRLWRVLRRERTEDARFVQAYPEGSLERAVAEDGFHPSQRAMNPSDTSELAESIGEYLDERAGGTDIASIARGAAAGLDDQARAGDVDIETAQAWIAQARMGDPDLPFDPDNDQIAEGIAMSMSPDASIADVPSRAEFRDRVADAMLSLYEVGREELTDAAAEFGRVRRRADHAIADRLGIRDPENGIEPMPGEWSAAIVDLLDGFGFDDGYRKAAAGVRAAEADYRDLGAWAFRGERFVPDPEQTDFGTMLEFVPGLSDEIREKLRSQAALTVQEKRTIRQAASTLEAEARRAESRNRGVAALEARARRAMEPSARERRLAARAAQRQQVPLTRARAADTVDGQQRRYRKQELVNPETGRLYADEVADMTDDELEVAAGDASFFPHRVADGGRAPTSARATGAVKTQPGTGSLTRASTGRRFATGNFSMDPMMLLEQAGRLVNAQRASDLYDAAVARGVPFDEATFAETGGAKSWVVLDRRGVKKLAERLGAMERHVSEIDAALGETRAAEIVERLRTMQSETARLADDPDGDLVMVPRGYYDRLAGDMKESSEWAKMIFDRPLDVFRTTVLFLTGRYYVNNVVGQAFLMSVIDPRGMPGYVKFVAERGKLAAARRMYGEAVNDWTTNAAMWDRVLQKHAAELSGASLFDVEMRPGVSTIRQRYAMSDARRKRVVAAMLAVPDEANRLGAMLSDDMPRMYRFTRLMEPHVKAARADGMDGDDAEIAMRLLDADETLRTRMIDQTLGDLIDYRTMSHAERVYVRRFIPFYGWMRGITEWTVRLGYDNPEKLWALNQVSTVGQDEANADWNSRVPTWLAGAVQIGDEHDGVQKVINTQGLNPLSTIGDLAGITRGLALDRPDRSIAGQALLGNINPFARAALASINGGKDLGTGMPVLMPGQSMNSSARDADEANGPPGLVANSLFGWAATTPPAMLVSQFRTTRDNQAQYGQPSSPTAVYRSPYSHYLASFLGLPVRDVQLSGAAARRARDEALLAGEGRTF